ncbi:MAG TPA: RsmE family RNA methyltransferase [Rhodothermales bacterium]
MTTTFFVPPDNIRDSYVRLPPDEARHAIRVLRHRPGDVVEVVDGAGGWYLVRLDAAQGETAAGVVLEARRGVGEPPYDLTLAVGLLKNPNRLETLVEKAVELGVTRLVPIETARTERVRIRQDRLERIAVAAMKQSGRSKLPEIENVRTFADLMRTESGGAYLICHEQVPAERSIARVLERGLARRITILVGPEGGFTNEEIAQAESAGYEPVSLGTRRLRAETAGIVAAAAVQLHAGKAPYASADAP